MSLRAQIESLLSPKLMERFAEQIINIRIIRYMPGQNEEVEQNIQLGPFPSWFTLYDVKLELWNAMIKNGAVDANNFAPPLVYLGIPFGGAGPQLYGSVEMVWKSLTSEDNTNHFNLPNPITLMSGPPDERFVDSSGGQKALGRDNRTRMTLDDVFQLSDGNAIPELCAFLYSDLIDRIPGQRPLSERDIYGRIVPYFPFLDIANLPSSTGSSSVITAALKSQAVKVSAALRQMVLLENQLKSVVLPKLDGVKLLRWLWYNKPESWEGAAVLFFGVNVTHNRPFMRFFPVSGQPLTKIKVRGLLPIPDLPDPNLLLSWKQDKNPENGKESVYMKLKIQMTDEEVPIFSTMRIFNDGTADLLIQPPKKSRLLDPLSDLQDAPEALDVSMADMPYLGVVPKLAQASVVFKLRIKREDLKITKSVARMRLKMFTSVFQEIPPLPDEQPLVMLRYKGVSNFTNETRIFAFLTLIAENEMLSGERDESKWAMRVSEEFQMSLEDARKQVIAWISQRGEFALAVSDSKDYILNKNPGVDIAIFEQHPTYTFHIYSDQDSKTYNTIVNMLGILITGQKDAFLDKEVNQIATMVPAVPAAPAAVNEPDAGENFAFDEDDIPEFMRATVAPVATPTAVANEEEEEDFAFDDEDLPNFMKSTVAAPVATPTAVAPVAAPTAVAAEAEDESAKAFEKPTDVSAIQLAKYYIDRLKLADPSIFNYQRTDASERGYVSHCAANESRQPIVLDNDEYREMRGIYDVDKDIEFVEYPTQSAPTKPQKRQPTEQEDRDGILDGRPYPSPDNKEVIWVVKYGSKAKKLHYYLCPRFFCIRDRLMIRAKDFYSDKNRHARGADKSKPETWPAKAPETCPFCAGTMLNKDDIKDKKRNPNKTVLQRKTRPGSDTERSIYVGFLDRRTPTGLALPCCFATIDNKFNPDDPEFVRLGLRGQAPGAAAATLARKPEPIQPALLEDGPPALAQPIADALQGSPTLATPALAVQQAIKPNLIKYDYYRVIQGVSVKSIVDSSRIPLRIVEPKTADDPKAGPQIGLLPEPLDTYFMQDSSSDKFAERIEIVSKLKPGAQGFLRLAVDNSNKEQSLLSAVAPFFFLPNAEAVISTIFDPIEIRIPPKKFIQINGGNLVHEFFKKCDKKHTNDMRLWAAKHLGISELKSSNIPAIERIMNSYECFKNYMNDPTQKKDLRVFFDIFSEPNMMPPRGILFIVLEMTVEEISIKKGDKIEFKTEIKFDKVRCPPYPLNDGQLKADIGFIVHYTRIIRDRYSHTNSYINMGWDPLFYVDGTQGIPESRHKPTLFFQRSQEASWPPIVQKRVSEFLNKCSAINRGPFTSEFGINPFSLISAQEIITAMRIQPNGMIRDAYNHFVGVGYKIPGRAGSSSGIAAVPISDDGTVLYERNIYLDWDDFDAPPINKLIEFFVKNINITFPQYKGYVPIKQVKLRGTDIIIGLRLNNQFIIPASNSQDSGLVSETEYPIEFIDHLDWDINKTIAYDSETRKKAFEDANKGLDKDDAEIKDPKADTYLKLDMESSQDEIEDVYQHLRLTFSTWLATGAGSAKRDKLKEILLNRDLPLNDKRKRLDILLYSDIHGWLEPKEKDEKSNIGFLRIDCQVQGEESCKGRCVWMPKSSDNASCGPCKIHTPKVDGTILNVPRMLYLRLVDELIRYAVKREEIFSRQVPRLTIRREAQRYEDQYIIPEGTSDWAAWWEMLRSEWITPEKEQNKFFDEQYLPIPLGMPKADTRVLPEQLKGALGPTDPKVDNLVWNPSTTPDRPFSFLRPVLRFHPITSKAESTLDISELDEIVNTNVQVLYMPSGNMAGSLRRKRTGATEAIIIAAIDGTVGWISQRDTYGIKIPLQALPDSLNTFRLV